MITVVEVAGARPNFVKLGPVHRALVAAGLDPIFVHTGQHYDPAMSDAFLADLGLPHPDVDLHVGSGTHAEQTARILVGMEQTLSETRPDLLVVVGDVNSTLGATLSAAKLSVPVAHVEAGLRSFDRTMPEEINRVVVDALSDLLLAPSPDAVDNLLREGASRDRIHLVGNVMIDSLDTLLSAARGRATAKGLGLERPFAVATLHRPATVDDPTALRRAVDVLVAAGTKLPVALVLHPRTANRIKSGGLGPLLEANDVRMLPPLGYLDFLGLVDGATCVLSDSGGVQEETTVLGVPCLTLRETTERPITVSHGTNVVVGLDPEAVAWHIDRISRKPRPPARRPPLWDGHAAERVSAIIAQWAEDRPRLSSADAVLGASSQRR